MLPPIKGVTRLGFILKTEWSWSIMGAVIYCSLLLGLIPAIIAVNPGLKLRITQNGLNYAATQAIKSLNLQGQTIPDIHGSDDANVGDVYYDITNARIQSFVTPHSGLYIKSGTGIHWSIQGASIRLTGNWHYHYKLAFISSKAKLY